MEFERAASVHPTPMIDPFGRTISYLRVSVTDRCDFRCVYCMAENMTFLPKADLLTLEELDRLCSAFIVKGVRKLRLTGGEPLVRRGIMTLFSSLARHLASGALDELTLTTNGSQLPKYAGELAAHGVKRVNVSLDTLDPDKFRAITRWGELYKVCESCNRVRLTCTGTLYMCLGQEDAADLRSPLRASEGNNLVDAAIESAILRKPKGHDFVIDRRHQRPALARHMSVTGG